MTKDGKKIMRKNYCIKVSCSTIGEFKKLIAEIPEDYAVKFGALEEFYIDVEPAYATAFIDAESFVREEPKRVCGHCGSTNIDNIDWDSYYAEEGSGIRDYVTYECKDCGKYGQHTYHGYLAQNTAFED